MNVGDRYSLGYAWPHRVEATIATVKGDNIEADVVHRCDPPCELQQMRGTLPIEGRLRYLRREFEALFQPMCDAPALPPAENRLLSI